MGTRTYNLAIIGFGNVGQGLAQILADRGRALTERIGARFQIVAVSDLIMGNVFDPDGFPADVLLHAIQRDGNLMKLPGAQQGWDALQTIANTNADVIVELSYTDLEKGEPATTYIRRALELGKHVITTNKGPIALHFPELRRLAHDRGVEIGVEGTVLSGTPALRLGKEMLTDAGIQKIQGILNGTTNYILTQMEQGATYTNALAEAQEKGYAEFDPTSDVEGYDTAGKVVILANLLMDLPLTMKDINRQGITHLKTGDIVAAHEASECWKLIGAVERTSPKGYKASVQPIRLPQAHPLANIRGATNAIMYSTRLLGDVILIGPGAGRIETGYALIGDMLEIHRKMNRQ